MRKLRGGFWRNTVARLRAALASIHDQAKANAFTKLVNALFAVLLFGEIAHIQFGSTLFIVGLVGAAVVLVAFIYRFYMVASAIFVILLCSLPILSFARSSYFVASDDSRFFYGEVSAGSYVVFPSDLSFIRPVLKLFPNRRTIDIINCNDVKVARLPLLPYKPLYKNKHLLGRSLGFRRLPPFRFDRIELAVKTGVGTHSPAEVGAQSMQESKQEGIVVKVGFGFSDAGYSTYSVTELLPRTVTCIDQSNVPLIPILEFLPWQPEQINSLIEAVSRVWSFRDIYENQIISLSTLERLRLRTDDSSYSTLLDFLTYSLLDHMLSGNILAETRADIKNSLCFTIENKINAFSGPFLQLKESFHRRLITDVGERYRAAYPACRIPINISSGTDLTASEHPTDMSFISKFRGCLENAPSVGECLAQDDVAQPQKTGGVAKTELVRSVQAEFDAIDNEFSGIVVNDVGNLLPIARTKPSDCPSLRDEIEDNQFVDWWVWNATQIIARPFSCSSPQWREEYMRHQHLARDAIVCSKRKGVRDEESLLNVEASFQNTLQVGCQMGNADQRLAQLEELYGFADKVDALILKLKQYEGFIEPERLEVVVKWLETLSEMRRNACGDRDTSSCVKEYVQSGQVQKLMNKMQISADVVSLLSDDLPTDFANVEKLNNVITNIALCDLLQSEVVSKRVGRSREEFCDSHGLSRYRIVSSEQVSHIVERTGDLTKGERGYSFETSQHSREYMMRLPLGK
jgi:hypothetical protein